MKRFAILALMMFSASAAHAVTGTATFNGLIAPTCILTAGTAGTLIPNADYTNLSSANAGGLESTV